MNAKPRVKNEAELNERLAALPELSRKVYAAIKKGLYAEPRFSDLTAKDITKALGLEPHQISGCIAHLTLEGLVYTEDCTVNRQKHEFLHTWEHDEYN